MRRKQQECGNLKSKDLYEDADPVQGKEREWCVVKPERKPPQAAQSSTHGAGPADSMHGDLQYLTTTGKKQEFFYQQSLISSD